MKRKWQYLTIFLVLALIVGTATVISAAPNEIPMPNIDISVGGAETPKEYVENIQILILMTMLTLLPSMILGMTSFTRISVVFGFLRSAMGTQQTPSNRVLIGLTLFLTLFVMTPTFTKINDDAIQPYVKEEITQEVAIEKGSAHMKDFMLKQTREKDLKLFMDIQSVDSKEKFKDLPLTVIIPAFLISELKTAFTIGFLLFLPFLIIDIAVGSVLMSMGMFMIPPMMVALPFKLLLFVMVDGWNLLIESLIMGFS